MLIINADDLGRDRIATDACLECHRLGAVTSASLMVFMADSARAAALARAAGLETGLHLNFTQPFDGPDAPAEAARSQVRIVRYLRLGKWPQVVYNPLLRSAFAGSFHAQVAEFRRLMGAEPAHFNGHNHMHLSMNMIVASLIPAGSRVRRTFTFRRGEKDALNRFYRARLDAWLLRRHISTEAFYSLDPVSDAGRRERIIGSAVRTDVELMAHPWMEDQFELLRGRPFLDLVASVPKGGFTDLGRD